YRASVQARQQLAVRRGAIVPSHVSHLHRHCGAGSGAAQIGAEALMAKEALPIRAALRLGARAPRERPGPLDYMRRWPLRLIVGAVLLFLYLPLITLMVFSFNDSRRNIVWQGFTLKYYEKALANESLIEAFVNSLTIAFFCTVVSVVLGALAA